MTIVVNARTDMILPSDINVLDEMRSMGLVDDPPDGHHEIVDQYPFVDISSSVATLTTIEASMVSPETLALAQAWQDGVSGKKPLPPQVMALFDLLVHDTLLTSWHDHILSPTLYFQTRATDTFGATDFREEAKQRAVDERHAQRVDQLPKVDDARARTGL